MVPGIRAAGDGNTGHTDRLAGAHVLISEVGRVITDGHKIQTHQGKMEDDIGVSAAIVSLVLSDGVQPLETGQ